MTSNLPFRDFESAAQAVLKLLAQRLPLGLWMITHTDGQNWVVLYVEDHAYGVTPGAVFRWADSFCCQMVKGHGPCIAPNSEQIPVYAHAPIAQQMPIKAYVGVPLLNSDTSVFGTLCAIDPQPQSEALLQEQALLELLAQLLSTVLHSELEAADELRRRERLEMEVQTDALTQLLNRRAWDQLLSKEDERCQRYASSAAVLVIDLDELKTVNDSLGHAAGDALLVQTARALHQATRAVDLVARLGGDEFGVIAVECDQTGAEALLERIRHTLAEQQIKASVGMAVRAPTGKLADAWHVADQRMYAEKRARANSR